MKGVGWQCDCCKTTVVIDAGSGPPGWLAVSSVGDGTRQRPVTSVHVCGEECLVKWSQHRIKGKAA